MGTTDSINDKSFLAIYVQVYLVILGYNFFTL